MSGTAQRTAPEGDGMNGMHGMDNSMIQDSGSSERDRPIASSLRTLEAMQYSILFILSILFIPSSSGLQRPASMCYDGAKVSRVSD